ncbi:TonB family protein [Saccharicrinis sp. FJH2]|uniref:energy transducer TonB n=1 Tax=Saccharicrinis sp. FJH65 TaxID=3344659 RepID=UPI0035F2B745
MLQKSILFIFALLITIPGFSQNDEKVYNASEVTVLPIFAQGKMSLADFLKFYQQYPEQAREKNVTGTVEVSLIVSSDGEILNSSISKGVEESLDIEALRLVDLMPEFSPAEINGKPVNCKINIDIPFQSTATATMMQPVTKNTAVQDQTAETVQKEAKSAVPAKKNPLYVIDGKIVNEDMKVNADNIESVRVIKGKKAIEKYGQRAADGVIIFTTKNFTNN